MMIGLCQPMTVSLKECRIRAPDGVDGGFIKAGPFQILMAGRNCLADSTQLIKQLDQASTPQLGSAK